MGIVISPTAAQIADLIIKANSRAMKGLGLLGYLRKMGQVAAALVDIRSMLNENSRSRSRRDFMAARWNF